MAVETTDPTNKTHPPRPSLASIHEDGQGDSLSAVNSSPTAQATARVGLHWREPRFFMEEKGRMGMSNMWVLKKTAQPNGMARHALGARLEAWATSPSPRLMEPYGVKNKGQPHWLRARLHSPLPTPRTSCTASGSGRAALTKTRSTAWNSSVTGTFAPSMARSVPLKRTILPNTATTTCSGSLILVAHASHDA
jgi:hypothetical protein